MAGQQDELAKAIISKNWELVRKYYEYIYDEKAPKSPILDTDEVEKMAKKQLNGLASQLYEVIKPYINPDLEAIVESLPIQQATEEMPLDDSKLTEKTSKSKGKDTKFITGQTQEDQIPGYKDVLAKTAKLSKTVEGRNEYKPRMIKCVGCSNEFDYNKEYPSGTLDPQIPGDKCNKCRNKRKK